jgi:ABC-type antimicrobial peptide transport system permease subunit
MPLQYAFKRVVRSWRLSLALLIGIILASTFFAGIDIKANVTAKQALERQLGKIYVDMEFGTYNLNSTELGSVKDIVKTVDEVSDAEWITRFGGMPMMVFNGIDSLEYNAQMTAIVSSSQVFEGWLNRPTGGIGRGEAYIPEGCQMARKVKVNDTIQISFFYYNTSGYSTEVPLNLTIKGFAQLDDKAYSIASGYRRFIMWPSGTAEAIPISDLLLVSWERTLRELWDAKTLSGLQADFLLYLHREALVNAWDIQTSSRNVQIIRNSIEQKLDASMIPHNTVQNNLEQPLLIFTFQSMSIRFGFTIVSIPIFFMAWYMGTTVSDVSFNLRRREIGLLLTKGFSRGQVRRTLLFETLLIGIIGGILGVLLGFLLVPVFTQFNAALLFDFELVSPYTIGMTIAFGVIIALLSAYSSSKRASQLATVDALREYLPMETDKPYRKRLPWLAFILGTYKIVVFILGLNVPLVLSRAIFSSGNFVLLLLAGIFIVIDAILVYIGPLLFFWGSTKLFIQSSLKFQELTTRAARFLGELGALATKNVRRNPARMAAIAFLIALIVSYSTQVNGQLASEHDFAVRTAYYEVGADIAVYVSDLANATNISSAILSNLSASIGSSTIEYSLETGSGRYDYMSLKAVQPQSWLETAYYEMEWFAGNDATTAFNSMATDNNTIILRRSYAADYDLKVNDVIALSFGTNNTKMLRIVGFFGPEPSEQVAIQTYWSFIPEGLCYGVNTPYRTSSRMLIKLKPNVDGENVTQSIQDLGLEITSVQSFAERWRNTQSDVISVGQLDAQRLGIFFAVLAASVGTALVSTVSMRERSHEATIMSVKGLSYKQLVIMFLTENLSLVTFSVVMGLFVGFITLYGNLSASNAFSPESLIHRHFVFPLDSVLTLAFCLSLIFVSTVFPILIMSRRYVTRLERMVRLR